MNPWESISLEDYEGHMSLDSVCQLQTMEQMMEDQFYRYPIRKAIVLGVAGGNGLSRVDPERLEEVVGVDINHDYLKASVRRYPELSGTFRPCWADLLDEDTRLPQTQLVIANLLVEYVGCGSFAARVRETGAEYVSVAIQINERAEDFVSDSPYQSAFEGLERVHRDVGRDELTSALNEVGYGECYCRNYPLPNGKALLRIDYHKR